MKVGGGRMVGVKDLVLLALLGRLAQAAVIQTTTPPPQTTTPGHDTIPPHQDTTTTPPDTTTTPPDTTTTPPDTTTPQQDCFWDGEYYPAGQDFTPSPCAFCHCPETGGEAMCAMMSCMLPACVDFTTEPGQCCPTCPNGNNCYVGETIIPAEEDVKIDGMVCRCPDPWSGNGHLHQEAECRPDGCLHYDGNLYPVGEFQPSPCEFCHCPEGGGEAFCAIADCFITPCVDFVRDPNQCCPTCPNGPNCYVGEKIIPAEKDVKIDGMVCRCPDPWSYDGHLHQQAVCRPDGCLHYDGKLYPPGDFKPSPCEWCHCPPEGGEAFCAIAACAMPMCVDSVREPDQCCPTCPNGPNCFVGEKIIPAEKDVKIDGKVCRCPDPWSGNGQLHQQAVCRPDGCLHYDGKLYPPGDFKPSPCEWCHCPPEGGEAFCAIADCAMPMCVDSVREPDQCCPRCPNGPNCYYGEEIVPAGEEFKRNGTICRCPDHHYGFGWESSAVQAECVDPSKKIKKASSLK